MTGTWLEIEPERRALRIDGTAVRVGARAFDVLCALARRRGQFVSRSALLELAWPGVVVEENSLEVQVSALRRLLGRDAIATAAGRGYSLVLAAAPSAADAPADAWRFMLAPAPPSSPHNLPQALTSFIGRDAEIARLLELTRKTRLLTLTGSGGCGKTRLSIELARRLLPRFAQGAWLVELAALSEAALVPQAVATALGLSAASGKPALQLVTEHLAQRSVLLVLDNAEHLLDPCAQLAATVLSRCAGVTVLVSSRTVLGVTGEATFRVPSLSMPDPLVATTPERLAQSDAVRLFVERAQLHRADFEVTVGNAAQMTQVCTRLDGIPLAIELGAARLRTLSLDEVTARLDRSFELLVGGSRAALPRHQTLRALIDWSHDLLDAAERRLFARVSVFSHGFSLAAAEAVCSGGTIAPHDVLTLLTALADKSLLSADDDDSGVARFRMLETVCRYAGDRLQDTGDALAWRGRHLAYFAGFVDAAEPGLKGPEQRLWLARLEAEQDNLRAALRESLAPAGPADAGLRMAAVLWRFWSNRGHASEGLVWVERLLARQPEPARTELVAKVLHGAGVMAHTLCDYAAADRFHDEALALRRMLSDPEGIADSLHCLSSSAMVQGHYVRAEALATDCLAMRRRLGNARSLAGSLNNVAGLAAIRGDTATAAPLYEEAVRLHRAAGNDHGIALGLVNLGVLASSLGDFALAAERHEEALRIHRTLADGRAVAMDLTHLGQVALERGDTAGARNCYRECLASVRERGDPLCAVELLQGLARLGLAAGQAGTAARLYGAAMRRREEIGAPIEPADRPLHERRVEAVRQALGDAFEREWKRGRSSGLDEALREAESLC